MIASTKSFSNTYLLISLSPLPAPPVKSGEPLRTMPMRLPIDKAAVLMSSPTANGIAPLRELDREIAALSSMARSVCLIGSAGIDDRASVIDAYANSTLLHFGDQDHSIPLTDVETIKQKRPEAEIYIYHAGHGFSCDERSAYDEAAHKEALGRTLGWLTTYVG